MDAGIDKTVDRTGGWRGSRELWLEAALEALIEGGVDAVKIQPLAARLALSRTSFYWFFKDRKELLAALLDLWEEKNTGALIAMTEAYAESAAEAVLNVIAAFLDETGFDPRLDFAVRGWALQDPDVADRLNEVDERRLAALRSMLERQGCPATDADVRARTMYLVQTGYIAMQIKESLAIRMTRVPDYVRIFSGRPPTARELARFHARFGYEPEPGAGVL